MDEARYVYADALETSRLRTRFVTADDIPAWTQFFADPEAVAFFPTFGLTSNEARAAHWIEKQLDRYATQRFGLQGLVDKQTGAFVGQCGLLLQDVEGSREIEVGYHIFQKYWGNGYAPEAAKRFIGYAFENELCTSVISIIDVRNVKSQRVAEKNALVREIKTRWFDLEAYIYRVRNNGSPLP